ncbi:hypothetical protein LZD49_26340 [Dyadobacter sp. CY261]|uniref:hypothetical protein n=1 Tax=Dyadobacter sp. CY261 TaxID=2907203 RepID=UPI001F18EA65|nr:hypothetical protein [Dyadobacter sp. CY261]MCF0074029.1 hypothetical protein [Dyadobacter sp. CY261]
MKQQINKLVGYCELKLDDGQVIPMKFGFDATTEFCKHFGIKPSEIYTTFFEYAERDIEVSDADGKKIIKDRFPVCNDVQRFLPAVLWCGADYVSRFEGGDGYRIIDATNWIDEIGGPASDQLPAVYAAFFKAISNGGSPPKESTLPVEMQQAKKKNSRQGSR